MTRHMLRTRYTPEPWAVTVTYDWCGRRLLINEKTAYHADQTTRTSCAEPVKTASLRTLTSVYTEDVQDAVGSLLSCRARLPIGRKWYSVVSSSY